ncbi:AraC family transcriptional regulator [Limosilactobacillus sp. Sa3CUN2]|uniref:AraC family transcriptional regulator n=1 Tax=Limosilactobacillus avistercoris TaxID=2762243 RepID=A0ABR8PE94_9LACO|nr:AraC family transcriptional regulator [Limosilactobacillus avistercoris]MBD7895600.1 AraC family transcriptional regulator [Limosilactobacillus avistercoris]
MERAYTKNYAVDKMTKLGLTSVGRSDTLAGHKYGPAVRPYYLIHFILSGSGIFKVNNISYHLHAGQGFLIEPNFRTFYIADNQTPWSYVWVGFAGSDAQTLVKQLPISEGSPVFDSDKSYEMVDCVNRILKLDNKSLANKLYGLSCLLRFLSYVSAGTNGKVSIKGSQQNDYVKQAIQYISQHLETVSVDQLARVTNINRSYLSDLFKRELDLTPSEYIRNFRITKARHLLESSNISIDQVAEQCGYELTNTFTRLFKRAYGISPRKYRQQSQRIKE